jgi:C1A family cysteine protease
MGDTGAFIRNALGCLVYFGVPPAETYPYNIEKFEHEPLPRVYILAQSYQVTQYFRLDYDIKDPQANLKRIKEWTAKGFPIEFGFTCYKSALEQSQKIGEIPYPSNNDSVVGGHAVMIVGYDDNRIVINYDDNSSTTGAFLIRNSWGTEWGEEGYGYLPYQYVLSGYGLAQDFWTIVKNEWVDKDAFHF